MKWKWTFGDDGPKYHGKTTFHTKQIGKDRRENFSFGLRCIKTEHIIWYAHVRESQTADGTNRILPGRERGEGRKAYGLTERQRKDSEKWAYSGWTEKERQGLAKHHGFNQPISWYCSFGIFHWAAPPSKKNCSIVYCLLISHYPTFLCVKVY